jgi:hypothetical protein
MQSTMSMPFTRTTWKFKGNVIFKGRKTMKMPKNVMSLISAYSKPITRGNWKRCKSKYIYDLWDEILDNKVFNYYMNKSPNYAIYLPTSWGDEESSDEE